MRIQYVSASWVGTLRDDPEHIESHSLFGAGGAQLYVRHDGRTSPPQYLMLTYAETSALFTSSRCLHRLAMLFASVVPERRLRGFGMSFNLQRVTYLLYQKLAGCDAEIQEL